MYLVDTNVWLERLLDQANSEEVGRFLDDVPSDELFITDFAFHSIAVALCRLGQVQGLSRFVQDAFTDGAVSLVHLGPEEIHIITAIMEKFKLDFDDAYQYAAAEKYNLTLISFDSDFDRTERRRKKPEEIVRH